MMGVRKASGKDGVGEAVGVGLLVGVGEGPGVSLGVAVSARVAEAVKVGATRVAGAVGLGARVGVAGSARRITGAPKPIASRPATRRMMLLNSRPQPRKTASRRT